MKESITTAPTGTGESTYLHPYYKPKQTRAANYCDEKLWDMYDLRRSRGRDSGIEVVPWASTCVSWIRRWGADYMLSVVLESPPPLHTHYSGILVL